MPPIVLPMPDLRLVQLGIDLGLKLGAPLARTLIGALASTAPDVVAAVIEKLAEVFTEKQALETEVARLKKENAELRAKLAAP